MGGIILSLPGRVQSPPGRTPGLPPGPRADKTPYWLDHPAFPPRHLVYIQNDAAPPRWEADALPDLKGVPQKAQTFREDDRPDEPRQAPRLTSLLRSRLSSLPWPRDAPSAAAVHVDDAAPSSARSQERRPVLAPVPHNLRGPACSAPGLPPRGKTSSRGPALFRGIFGRKRARSPTPPAMPVREAVKLKFLFVGDHGSGQTALLYRAAFGYFPDTTAIPKTSYETYTLDKPHLPAQMEL
ncbi:hypothetical protein E4U41_007197 [Claviceps citrina]|nr:hypothetical protein E4U41_007197 [Claviceps citrina]